MTVKDILALTDYDTTISICYCDKDWYSDSDDYRLYEAAVISPNTPIDEYTKITHTYGNKEVAQLRVDMTDTLTIIYKA